MRTTRRRPSPSSEHRAHAQERSRFICGIAGFSLSPEDNTNTNSKVLARELLLGIEHRGRDATGFAFLDSTGRAQVHKGDSSASDFVRRRLCIPKRTGTAICHTRMWTQGDPRYNENNHPIPQGTIVGVHNGWLTNDAYLWGDVVKRDRQQAEVDSEVIFAMLAYGQEDSGASVIDALESIKGNAAVAWIDREFPEDLYLARATSSPLFVAQTKNGSLIFASEGDVVMAAADKARLEVEALRDIPEGTFLTVRNGEVLKVEEFKPQKGYRYTSGRTRDWSAWEDEYYVSTNHGTGTTTVTKSAKDSAVVFATASGDITAAVVDNWLQREAFDPAVAPYGAEDSDVYYGMYQEREGAIDDWFHNFRGPVDTMQDTALRLKAYVKPGQHVTTKVAGKEVLAQVVAPPMSFPGGKWLLRALIEKPRPFATGSVGHEVVLIERQWTEFDTATATKPEPVKQTRLSLTQGGAT